MKAPEFDYHRPDTLQAALEILANTEDAAPLAGGQSLMPMMNFRLARPEALVDLNHLPELAEVTVDGGHIHIGAMMRYADLAGNAEVQRHLPLMIRAIPHIAHSAIRNRGTIGGSCALADPAAEMPALLLALDARITIRHRAGQSQEQAQDFFIGPYETALSPDGAIIEKIQVPIPAPQRIGFHEIARRRGDYAMAGVAVAASEDLSAVRIAFFGVADRALRAEAAEAALAGSNGGSEALADAIAALNDIPFAADLHTEATTKRHLAGVALRRAWTEVMA